MEFDIVIIVSCIGIAFCSGILIYVISIVTMSCLSYDDIKASRRQEKLQPTNTDPNHDAKKLKKLKKKLKKESRENLSTASTQNNVEEVIVEEPVNPPEEEIPVPEPSVPIVAPAIVKNEEKHVSSVKSKHKTKVPKKPKDAEVIEPTPTKLQEPVVENEVEVKKITTVESTVKVEPLVTVENDVTNNSPDEENATNNESTKLKKKTKKKKGDGSTEDPGKISLPTLLPLLKQAEFSHDEVQILIDALLNKDHSEWLKGKQDPMLKLKKQLEEMEKLHADDTETINGLQVKLASLRTEINAEKANNKGIKEDLFKANSDSQALSFKIRQLREEKEALVLNIQQLKQQVSEEHLLVLKLQEQGDLYSQMNITHEQHHEAVVALQSQVNQLATQLTEEQNVNANLAAQLDDSMRLEEDYRQISAVNVELEHLLNNSRFEGTRLNTELVTLSKQLEDSRTQINDLSTIVKAIEAQKNELQSENELLKVEVSKANLDAITYQKMADTLEHNLEENKKNGSIHFHNEHSDCQSMLDEKDQIIKNLNKDLSQKELVLEKLKNDVVSCKNDSNKKQTMIENLNVELSSLKTIVSKISGELVEEKNIVTSLRTNISEKTETVNKLHKEVESHKHRNNELRSKNWKVVEALEKAEASLKELSLNANPVMDEGNKVAVIKCRINYVIKPLISKNIDISNIEDDDIWLAKCEEIINSVNKESNSENILVQNAKLQNLVTHYRSVITDLENMLSEMEQRIESSFYKQKTVVQPEVDVDD